MPLTPAQLTTLKAAILADSNVNSQPMNDDGHFFIAAYYNQPFTPDFFVWRTSVPVSEIMQNGFDWSRVDNLTVGKARVWEWMVQTVTLNPSQANVRTGVITVFSTAGDLAMRQAIFGHCQRKATRGEKLFATGTGSTTTDQGTGPGLLVFEGNVTGGDVSAARNLP